MKKYRLTEDGVQNTETTAFIPNDENNNDWNEYQNWLKGLDVEDSVLGNGLPNTPDERLKVVEV